MDTKPMDAWTLPELLVVMILSGLIFLALLDATDLIRRFTLRFVKQWDISETTLNAYHQLDELITRADSISERNEGFQLYRYEEELAFLRQSDSLLLCHYQGRNDTLFHCVRELKFDSDTLFLLLNYNRQKVNCYWKIRKIVWP